MATSEYLRDELRELIRSNADIFTFIENAALDGLWFWDVENPANEWYSPGFKRLFGYEDHEIENTSQWWQDNIHPDDLTVAFANFEAHCADPSHAYDQVVRYTHKRGHTVWVRCRGYALRDDEGNAIRLLGAHTDVTALKNQEMELIESNKELEAALKTRDDFLSFISHEIRTPLNGLIGMLSLTEYDKLDTETAEQLKYAETSANSLNLLLNDLLDLSKIQSNKMDIEAVTFDVSSLANEVNALMTPNAEEKGLAIKVNISDVDYPYCIGDPHRIKQIIYNLLSNAIKFTAHGDISLAIRTVDSKENFLPDQCYLECEVSDNGIGIAEENLEKIFEVFAQADSSTARKFGGTGLGLSICKSLSQLMGGDIKVESTIGKGSKFSFHVLVGKVVRSSTKQYTQSKIDSSGLSDKLVYIVEDHPVNQKLMARIVERAKMNYQVFSNGKEILEKLKTESPLPDIILCDLHMPVMDGEAVITSIRKGDCGSKAVDLPVIAVTAGIIPHNSETDETAGKRHNAGFTNYVLKPIDQVELYSKMRKCLQNRQ